MMLWSAEAEEAAGEEPEPGAPSQLPPERKQPTLHGEVFVLASESFGAKIRAALTADLTVRTFTNPGECSEALSGNVALVILSAALSEDLMDRMVREAIVASPHARLCLVASDGAQLLRTEVPHDEAAVAPMSKDEFTDLVKRLYVRAYYDATITRFYKIAFSIKNLTVGPGAENADVDERVPKLESSRDLLQGYLTQFRNYLEPEDLTALKNRDEQLEELAKSSKRGVSPAELGLPDKCPDCALSWTEWHGRGRRDGYEKIGANTWRCTGCGHILADTDQNNYRVS